MMRKALFLAMIIISANVVGASRPHWIISSSAAAAKGRSTTTSSFAFCRSPYAKNSRSMMDNNSRIISIINIGPLHSTAKDIIVRDEDDDDAPTIPSLLQRGRQIRQTVYGDIATTLPSFVHDSSLLGYPASTYNMQIHTTTNNSNNVLTKLKQRNNNQKQTFVQRGFCNWLLPNKIMIGQYPGTTPENEGASSEECKMHVKRMAEDAGITVFCCLQSEVPAQDDDAGWKQQKGNNEEGEEKVYLEDPYYRREFPRPFTRYGPLAQSLFFVASDDTKKSRRRTSSLAFMHAPIEDLSVPACNDTLLQLLSKLLLHLDNDNEEDDDNGGATTTTIYLHCWGGRGRAGLIGSCLASLLFPELSAKEVLGWVQGGYDSRLGAEHMPEGLKRSPQTEAQRAFVREFVDAVHAERR